MPPKPDFLKRLASSSHAGAQSHASGTWAVKLHHPKPAARSALKDPRMMLSVVHLTNFIVLLLLSLLRSI
jgi:hypothetical protein